MEPKVAKVGQNSIRLMVSDAAGDPVPDADVDVTLFMPQMGKHGPHDFQSKSQTDEAG